MPGLLDIHFRYSNHSKVFPGDVRNSSRIDEGEVYIREGDCGFLSTHVSECYARFRSRRGPVVHPPDPFLSSPIPQHLDVNQSHRVAVSH